MGRRFALVVSGGLLLMGAAWLMVRYPPREPFVFSRPAMVRIPAGTATLGSREFTQGPKPAEHRFNAFWISVHEITVGEFTDFLNSAWEGEFQSPQIRLHRDRYVPVAGQADYPVAYVSHPQATAYAAWLGKQYGLAVRLPTETEWEYAARGGIERARYPWGWGTPEGRACFHAASSRTVGSYRANAYGLYDMAGNVFEWCTGEEKRRPARGGSWSERDPQLLRVFHRVSFPIDYRDADVGFRVVAEENRRGGGR